EMATLRKYRNMRRNFAFLFGRYIHKSSSFMNGGTLIYIYNILKRDQELRRIMEEAIGTDMDEFLSMDL
ncbi:MAG: hypothetical protein QW460_01680, partial [Thermoplasmatales archaeon]